MANEDHPLPRVRIMSGGEDGGPIHPIPEVRDMDGNGIMEGWRGMSLRDWFAGQVAARMIGLCENDDGSWDAGNVAAGAYMLADAMLAERAKAKPLPTDEGSPSLPAVSERGEDN